MNHSLSSRNRATSTRSFCARFERGRAPKPGLDPPGTAEFFSWSGKLGLLNPLVRSRNGEREFVCSLDETKRVSPA
jgi:hypothetical protein